MKSWILKTIATFLCLCICAITSTSAKSINCKKACHSFSSFDVKKIRGSKNESAEIPRKVFTIGCYNSSNLIDYIGLAVRLSAKAAKGGTRVLGNYSAYTKLATELGARRFQIPTNVWNKLTAAEQWAANQKFLDRMIL